jgi:hypothetical protein
MFIKDGIYFIIAVILLILAVIFSLIYTIIAYALITIGIFLLIYLLSVFYIPKIKATPFPKTFLSPANGKIISIKNTTCEGNEFNEVTISISNFKSHINMIPLSGKVTNVRATYNITKGNSIESITEIVTEFGNYYIKQVALGFFNKLVNNLYKDMSVDTDIFFGYIIFKGSITLLIPPNFEILVLPKDKVEAGIDVIARLK